MGRAWERIIGVSKKVLNVMLFDPKHKDISHDVLTSLMAEVCATVNNIPLTYVSSDPKAPTLLTPSMLLTMRSNIDVKPFPKKP